LKDDTRKTIIRHLKGIVAALEKTEALQLKYLAVRCYCSQSLMVTYEEGKHFEFTCMSCKSRIIGLSMDSPDEAEDGLKSICKKL
jgi:hypothetical protein